MSEHICNPVLVFKDKNGVVSWTCLARSRMDPNRPLVVGISGSSFSGKTTLAGNIRKSICGHDRVKERRRGKRDHASRLTVASGSRPRVSILCQDSFFRAQVPWWQWDTPDALNHELTLAALREECNDLEVDCVIFDGFQAYHDKRVIQLLDIMLWLEVNCAMVSSVGLLPTNLFLIKSMWLIILLLPI